MKHRRLFWTLLAVCLLVAFVCVAYPMYVIRPFRAQGVRELAAALFVLRIRALTTGIVAGVALAVGVALVAAYHRWLPRIGAALLMLLTFAFALLAHVNVYELMFHPMGRPSFEPGASSKLDGGEEVMAINVNGVARAYPVRSMSYHHIANDIAGGVPVVATY